MNRSIKEGFDINIRQLAVGGVFAALAALFQAAPVLLSEAFLFVSILSAMPVLLTARIKPLAGMMVYMAAALIIFSISPHEALFFIMINGLIGLILGSGMHFGTSGIFVIPVTSIVVTVTISCINFLAGIPVLWVNSGYHIVTQLGLFFLILLIYCSIYWLGAKALAARLANIGTFFNT